METTDLLKNFSKYVAFNVAGMLATSCYILADTFFVAKGLGSNGLTALNLAIPIYNFIHGTGLMIGIGGGALYSILKSEGRIRESSGMFPLTLLLGAAAAFLFLLAGLFFSGTITRLLGADPAVFDMTRDYLRTLLLCAAGFIFNNILVCFVRNDGSPGLSMAAMTAGSFSNIILDYVFIFPLNMGILGAVIATCMAPIISLCVLSLHFFRGNAQFGLCRISFSLRRSGRLLSLGASSLITEAASGIVIIVFNLIILALSGNTGVAAYGIIANLSLVITAIFTGIAQGIQPLISHAYGKRQLSDVRIFCQYGVFLSSALAVLLYVVLILFKQPVIAVFNNSGDTLLASIASHGIVLYFLAFPFVGINIISASVFSASARPIQAFILSCARGFAVILPCVFLLSHFFEMTGVWLSFPVSEALCCCFAVFMLWKLFFHTRQ